MLCQASFLSLYVIVTRLGLTIISCISTYMYSFCQIKCEKGPTS